MEGGNMIRGLVTFVVVFFVLALLLGVFGWAGPLEVVLLVALSAILAVAASRLRPGVNRTDAR
jgi:membrane protein implicated in regulation of membrane protease activity